MILNEKQPGYIEKLSHLPFTKKNAQIQKYLRI